MNHPRFKTLRSRIIALVIVAGSLAVGLFTAVISWANNTTSIVLLDQRLTTLADVIGQNSTAALDFNDRKAAQEVLEALRTEPAIISACLYDQRGSLFSEYKQGENSCPKRAGATWVPSRQYRKIQRAIFHASDNVGSIEITADLHDLNRRNHRTLLLAIGLAILSMSVAGGSGALLQRRICKPIMELAGVMNQVTQQGALEARVCVEGIDEIAQLAHGFNRMIAELERRNEIARKAELRLLEQSRSDSLTGLPNRRYFAEQLERELSHASREQEAIGLLYIDLDGFKLVNDSLGHVIGDLLLVEVAKRFQSRVRAADMLARLGGDEFTIILSALKSEKDASIVADALIQCLSSPFVIEGNQITVGASIGVSTLRPQVAEDQDLLRQADNAMYAAKRSGKNRVVHFSSELGLLARERLTLERELRGAIGREEIYVEYQPEFNIKSGQIVRFEALARWRHAHLGEVSPATFIPIAEEGGLVRGLGEFVMEQACRECLEWQKLSTLPIHVAVNVSALQFNSDDFVDVVSLILKRTGLNPKLLQLELTESVMIGSFNHSVDKMMKLRSLGASLAIDDFGTGYSSLSYLSGLPFTTLKIDRAFLRNLRPGSEAVTMIRSMIELGHKMHMGVIVEGIETEAQLETVIEMGADEVQGYLLGLPSQYPRAQLSAYFEGDMIALRGRMPSPIKSVPPVGRS